MNNLITIDQNDQRVLTTEQLAGVYGTDIKNISKNFNRNRDKFIEGKHFFILQGSELKTFKTNHLLDESFKCVNRLYLWTERGANRHCKILNTTKAWEQFEALEDTYFSVKEQYRQQFVIPNNMSDALQLAADLFEENQMLIQKAKAYDQFMLAENACTVGTAAKILGSGQKRLFQFLRERKILVKKDNTPYQKYVDAGYFRVVMKRVKRDGERLIVPVPLVTPKGLEFLAKLLDFHPALGITG
jgi:phage antirepressor YoqD-like protein